MLFGDFRYAGVDIGRIVILHHTLFKGQQAMEITRNDNDRSPDASDQLKGIHTLFRQGKFKEARPMARKLVKNFPADPLFHVTLSLCYSEAQDPLKALDILSKAAEKFPDDHNILYHIAGVHEQMEHYQKSETYYRQALEHTPPEMNVERSECYNGIGVALWYHHRREEALEMWRRAVNEDPANETAKHNLQEFTNEYGRGKAPKPLFDDLYQFQKIQLDKHNQTREKDTSLSDEELRQVMGSIMRTWNEKIAPLREKLDRLTAAEKTELFTSVECDFSLPWKTPVIPLNADPTVQRLRPTKEEKEFMDKLNVRFAFLGADAGPLLLLYGTPALISVGVKKKRFRELMQGSTMTTREKSLLAWAYDIIIAVLAARDGEGGETDWEGMLDAYEVARVELDRAAARRVLLITWKLIGEYEGDTTDR
jgi:tetratricopeptide (TPR) repeat protein